MNGKEQRRAMILTGVIEGRLTPAQAVGLMSLSERQERRLRRAFIEDGPAALVHGNRGRRPAHTLSPEICERVVALAEGVYMGCNDQHLTELLAEREGITLSRSSLRRIRRAAGLRSPRRRRAPRHRGRRERMPQAGMLLQIDGSRHQWLGPDGPWLTLIGAIDDATGDVPCALFREQEDSQGYLLLLREVVRKRGVPLALYSDRHKIFQAEAKEPLTLEEELAGKPLPTQVRRVLDELDINWIGARSPQAKGRVERLWGTLQDRLCQELRLAGVTTLEHANAALPASLAGRLIHIPPGPQRRSFARARVEIREHLDGSASVHYQGARIAQQPAQPGDLRTKHRGKPEEKAPPLPKPNRTPTGPWKPPPDHPWRHFSLKPSTRSRRTFSLTS